MPFWLTWFLVGLVTAGTAAAVAVHNPSSTAANGGMGPYYTQQFIGHQHEGSEQKQ